MKRYTVEASTFEEDGTESHKVLYSSNSVTSARAYLEGLTSSTDWQQYDLINVLDTAQASDSEMFLVASNMSPAIFNGSYSQQLADFSEVWSDVSLPWTHKL